MFQGCLGESWVLGSLCTKPLSPNYTAFSLLSLAEPRRPPAQAFTVLHDFPCPKLYARFGLSSMHPDSEEGLYVIRVIHQDSPLEIFDSLETLYSLL